MEAIDALTEAFAVSQVTLQENCIAAPHPRFANLYKKKNSVSQEERRKRFLEAQKEKRYDYALHARNLATAEWSNRDEQDKKEPEESEEMDFEIGYFKRPSRSYRNQIMNSEWLVEVPDDLAAEWLLVLCPTGKRCLVVASRGITKAYSRGGAFLSSFPSRLPGGTRKGSRGKYSLLDCIYSEINRTYYILDVMCWNSHPCYDSETDFRFYWITQKTKEHADIQETSGDNPFKFIPLPSYKCDAESIHKVLHSPLPFEAKLDGLLFFHKRTHYVCGTTPLVTWLKAYMVPEILNIEVPDALCSDKPSDYICMQQLLPKAFEKNERRKKADEINMQFED